jgi:Zn-dependent protease with chaperone function
MMWAGGLLLAYAFLLATVGAAGLRRARWPTRSPRMGVAAWQILSVSALSSVALAGLLMVSPGHGTPFNFHSLVWSVEMISDGQFAYAGTALWCAAIIGVALAAMTATVVTLGRSVTASRSARARHRDQLTLVATVDARTGALVVDHDRPAAYCLPGRRAAVVLTTGALACMDGDELSAVLAHERAHLRERHDLVLSTASGLARVFGMIPLFRWAHCEQVRLVEMVADDAAARHAGRRTVATAMARMALAAAPPPALGAGGPHTADRVERLLSDCRPVTGWRKAAIVVGLATTVMTPIGIAVAPAATASGFQTCGPSQTA